MTSAYLDYNIFTSIEEGTLSIDQIRLNIDKNIKVIPFSAGHIEEVANITANTEFERFNFINQKLLTIRHVTSSNYLYLQIPKNEIRLLFKDPEIVLGTISKIPYTKPAIKRLVDIITPEFKTQIRKTLGVDTKYLNNYNPKQVVEHLNAKLNAIGIELNLLELIDNAISIAPGSSTYGLHNRIASVFEVLDVLGYWKDRQTDTSNIARVWDSNHTFFASYCDYFISDDKRIRYKARVVYEIYGIATKVLSSIGSV